MDAAIEGPQNEADAQGHNGKNGRCGRADAHEPWATN